VDGLQAGQQLAGAEVAEGVAALEKGNMQGHAKGLGADRAEVGVAAAR